jgi:hypothetical protein
MTTYIHHGREFIAAQALPDAPWDTPLDPSGPGSSATRRAAIARGSGCDATLSGRAPIKEANLWVAVSPGNSASLAASCHGSTSDRANPERTLTSTPFLSSPIGANKKSLNSDPVRGIGELVIWSSTCRLPLSNKQYNRTISEDEWPWQGRKIPKCSLIEVAQVAARISLGLNCPTA